MNFATVRAENITLDHKISVYGVDLQVIHSGPAKTEGKWLIEAADKDDDGEVRSAISLEVEPRFLILAVS